MLILTILIGFVVLVMGRQIFWVFIAGIGFALGLIYGEQFYAGQPDWMIFAISSIIAILGAVLAYTLQRLAGAIAGFVSGWYIANLLMGYFRVDFGQFDEIAPIIVGIIFAVLILAYFDWSVIIISSLAGSAIIVSGMRLPGNTELALLITFAIVGIVIQSIWFIQDDSKGR